MCLLSRDSIKSALPLKIFLTNQSGWGPSAGSLLPGQDTHQAQRQDHLGGTVSFFFFPHNKRQKVTSVRNLQQMLELEWVGMPMPGWGWIKTLPFSQVGSQAHSDSLPRKSQLCILFQSLGLEPLYLSNTLFAVITRKSQAGQICSEPSHSLYSDSRSQNSQQESELAPIHPVSHPASTDWAPTVC